MRPFLTMLLLMLVALPGQAAVFRDEVLQRAYEQGRYDELEREARTRIGAEALAAKTLATLATTGKGRFEPLMTQAEQCVGLHPDAAVCHFLLGSVLGKDAQAGGALRGLRLVGRVRDSLARAVQLDPGMFEARSALQMLLLIVPGIAGGSVDQARQLEMAVRDSQPEVAKLLRARLAAHAKRWDEAERELLAIRLGEQRSFHTEVLNAWTGLARQWMKDGQHAKARARFEQLAQQLPQWAQPTYQLGRLAADEGQHEEALRLYERARGMGGAPLVPLDYRMGLAWLDLGDRDRARQLLQRFLQAGLGSQSNLDDASKRLRELG
ncbi:tetratricopeptide repeat protein [Inhella sp.]|uniref:tetratricopeptide repeat protein n=1 Tax=Inhella sp. TaxID=1921806 RepID=UPI0035AE9D0C